MRHFFTVYKQLENKQTSVNVELGRDEAIRIIDKSMKFYQEKINEIINKG